MFLLDSVRDRALSLLAATTPALISIEAKLGRFASHTWNPYAALTLDRLNPRRYAASDHPSHMGTMIILTPLVTHKAEHAINQLKQYRMTNRHDFNLRDDRILHQNMW